MNFLEELVAEWYEYRGYLVRRNAKFAKRARGGYDGEMDVIAFDPKNKELIHAEVSWDANSWAQRCAVMQKKFSAASKAYATLFPFGHNVVKQVAIIGLTRPKRRVCIPNVQVILVRDFINDVKRQLPKDPLSAIVPEGYPLLRAMQLTLW